VALRYCTLKNLGLPSYLAQLLVNPFQILFLSPEYNFLVAPVLALSRHERRVSIQRYIGMFYFVFRFSREANCVSYAKTSVVQVTARFMPYHRDSTGIDIYVSFNQPVKCSRKWAAANFCNPNFIMIARLTAKIKHVTFPHKWWWRLALRYCQLYTNITNVVRFVPTRTWYISLQKSPLGTDIQRNCYFAPVHTQEGVYYLHNVTTLEKFARRRYEPQY
jgi:hypothetical protein